MARCSTSYLIRASQGRGPWLTLNAGSAAVYRKALQVLGAKVPSKMTKTEMWKALLKFPKADVQRAFGPKAELSEADREAMCRRLRINGFM